MHISFVIIMLSRLKAGPTLVAPEACSQHLTVGRAGEQGAETHPDFQTALHSAKQPPAGGVVACQGSGVPVAS